MLQNQRSQPTLLKPKTIKRCVPEGPNRLKQNTQPVLTLFSDLNGEDSTAMVANCSARLTRAISEIVSGIGVGLSRRRAQGSTCVGKMGEQGRHQGNQWRRSAGNTVSTGRIIHIASQWQTDQSSLLQMYNKLNKLLLCLVVVGVQIFDKLRSFPVVKLDFGQKRVQI